MQFKNKDKYDIHTSNSKLSYYFDKIPIPLLVRDES